MQLDDRNVRREERNAARMRAPADGCVLIDSNSAAVSAPACAALVGHADLADVVQQRAEAQRFLRSASSFSSSPIATAKLLTRSEWPAVYGSRASSAAASARTAPR
jgi:hypothetical protein